MDETIRALVAFSGDSDRSAVEAALSGEPSLEVIGYSDEQDEGWQTFFDQKSDVVILACDEFDARTTQILDRAVKQRPERPVVVATRGSQNGSLRQAFESGADDVLTYPLTSEQLRFTLEKVLARRKGGGHAGASVAPLICVLGPKGGTGKTLVSTNLAVALARRDLRVVLIDLDLQFGDVGLALGLAPERTIYDLAKAGGTLDADKVDGYLTEHVSGLKVLLAPTRPDQAGLVTVEFLRETYATLRTFNDYVIVDSPPGFTAEVIASIDSSSAICIVGMLDSLSLKNTKLGLETLSLMGYDSDRIRLVLNRADTRVGITHEDVELIIGQAPQLFIPSDRRIPISVNEGTPIVASEDRSEAA